MKKRKKKIAKKIKRKNVPRGTIKPIAAVVRWEDKFREEINFGEMIILCSDGTVYERAVLRSKEGTIENRKDRKKQTLTALKEDWKKDFEGMKKTWLWMMANRRPDFQIVNYWEVEKLTINALN